MNPKDMVVDIISLENRQAHASGSSAFSEDETPVNPFNDPVSNQGFRRRGAYAELSGEELNEDNDTRKETSSLQVIVYRLTKSVLLRRLLLYYLPPALVLLVAVLITLTVAKNAHIGDIHMVGLFVWLEVTWAIFWASWALAYVLPFVFQFFAGFISSGARHYTEILNAVIVPMTAFLWALFSRVASVLLCVFDRDDPGTCDDNWVLAIRKALLATVACTGLYFVEKVLIHLLTVNYRKRQFKIKVEDSKRVTHILTLMYEESIKLYPGFCGRFASEDNEIHRSQTLTAAGGKVAQQSRLRKTVSKFYGKEAMEETKSRLQGKEVLKPGSARSVVIRALETKEASEALARRLWLSFTSETDIVTEADIARILGPDREEDALDIFHSLDKDENGDISLDEMILLVTQSSSNKHNIERSMHDIGQAVRSLDRTLEFVLLFLSGLIYVAFFSVGVAASLATLWGSVAAVAFAIATTVQEFLGSLVFIFIKHPYDVGDRVDINKVQLVVEHISLLYTVFRQVDTGGIVQIPNIVNNTQWVKNVSRSKAMMERYDFSISPKTKFFQLENLKAELQKFVLEPQNKRDYQSTIEVEVIDIGNLEKLTLRVEICQKSNFSNEAIRASRRSKFMCALLTALKKHSISKPWGGKPPDAGSWENPAYTVTLTDSEAREARERWEASEEVDRAKKMEKLWWDGLAKDLKDKDDVAKEKVGPAKDKAGPAKDK